MSLNPTAAENTETSSLTHITTVLAVLLWMGVVYYAATQAMPRAKFGIVFLGLAVLVYLVDQFDEERGDRAMVSTVLLTVSAIGTIAATWYVYTNFSALQTERIGFATQTDYVIAAVALGIVIYLTYREFGVPFVSVIFASLIYAHFGPYFPGIFAHAGLPVQRLLQLSVTDISGVYGSLTQLMAAWIALFMLYAGLMQGYGAFDLILRGAVKTTGYIKSGVAQSAVVASIVIGSINGSGTANTGITGSLTIPLMKKSGIKAETAGGIESVASTGGQIMPPIMGAGAFLMAALLGIAYVDVLVAGLIPALIFYASVVVAVHLVASKQLDDVEAVTGIDQEITESKSRKQLTIECLQFIIPFIVLIYFLGIAQYTVMTSALYTCLVMLLTGITFPLFYESNADRLWKSMRETIGGLRIGALTAAPIAIIIAAINAIVDILMATGIPSTLAVTLAQASGGVLIAALVMSMVICIILGLGMPTSAAYLIVALLVAPALIEQFGLPDLSAHFFVFYAAILATITPPIATGVAVASGIARAGFWATAGQALRIGAPLFILPFMFAYHPELVSSSFTLATLSTGLIGLIGAVTMIYGFNYPFSGNVWQRSGLRLSVIGLGILIMLHQGRIVQLVGVAFIGAVVLLRYMTDIKILQPESSRHP